MTESARELRASAMATWDGLADCYNAQELYETRALETAVRLAAATPGERLVDLGTGTGLLLRCLAERPTGPLHAVGVDRSARMLARVGPLPSGWSTMLADARAVALPDGWADVVTCSYLLHLLDRAERVEVLAEARRLLRPEASSRLIVVTVWSDERRPGGRLISGALRLAARARPTVWGGLRPHDPGAELTIAGFTLTRRIVLPRHGYPSLVIAAARR